MTGTAIVMLILICGGIWGGLTWAIVRLLKLQKKDQ